MDFSIILAMEINRGIGLNGQLPWHKPTDMEYFKKITSNGAGINAIVMGRRTADSLPATLPGRLNIVITSDVKYRAAERFVAFTDLNTALLAMRDSGVANIFVIGGAKLAEEAILHKNCRQVYLTRINEHHRCDVFLSEFFIRVLETRFWLFSEKNTGDVCFLKYIYHNVQENQYLDLLGKILQTEKRITRNAETYSIFGERLEFDLQMGFPLLTTKKMFTRGILEELLFFLRGETDTKILEERGVFIWHDNTTEDFIREHGKNLKPLDMGPMYGYQWRSFNGSYVNNSTEKDNINAFFHQRVDGRDQLKKCIDLLISDPNSRRILMTSYNPAQAEEGVLYPCHGITIQFYVENGRISIQMYQRSADAFLGLPFNIASYAAMLIVVVALVNGIGKKNYVPGRLIIVLGDVHLYTAHRVAATVQMNRRLEARPFCTVRFEKPLKKIEDIMDIVAADFIVENYEHMPPIKAKMFK
jgi:dihydrofolate reductase/thymidylate synthase